MSTTIPLDPSGHDFVAGALGSQFGVQLRAPAASGWFAKLLGFYLRHREATRLRRESTVTRGSAPDRAKAAITRACIESSLTGAGAGLVATGATLVTAGTEGYGGLVAVPVAALAIGGEMAVRTWIHLDLISALADIFAVHFDPDKPDDIWRLCALAFGAHDEEAGDRDPGKALVQEITHIDKEELGAEIGAKILGESVMRNIVPVFGVATSAITNYRLTKRLGDTARRYMRYHRAMNDAMDVAISGCHAHLELLIEGLWFIFIGDGQLSPEESGLLASLVHRLSPTARQTVIARFIDDEYDWLERLPRCIEDTPIRQAFFHALEVAAAVDKHVGLPERRLLRSAARRLELPFDPRGTDQMMREFEDLGMLADGGPGNRR